MKTLYSDTSTTRLPIQISNSIIMNICFSMKQCKAIKTILCNQDLYNENILRLKVDISDMTLDEAHKIVNKMSQAKKDALNDILLGKIQPLPRYDFENSGKVVEQAMKELLFLFLFFIIVVALIGGHTFIGAGIFLCWLVYLLTYTDFIIPKWIKVEILHFIRKKGFKAPTKEK